jgi:hypothetical protein
MAAIASSTNSCIPAIQEAHFPGIGATFAHKAGDWKLDDAGIPLVRSIEFISTTPGSLLETFNICGYRDGNIIFGVKFQKELENSARIYFKFKNLELEEWICVARAKTPLQRSSLFSILSRHNTLPSEHHELIRKLAYAESWFEVTPLQTGETLARENRGPTLDNIYDLAHAFGVTSDQARSCLTQPKDVSIKPA